MTVCAIEIKNPGKPKVIKKFNSIVDARRYAIRMIDKMRDGHEDPVVILDADADYEIGWVMPILEYLPRTYVWEPNTISGGRKILDRNGRIKGDCRI